jgi:hypothetical protein
MPSKYLKWLCRKRFPVLRPGTLNDKRIGYMDSKWKEEYASLQQFIADNSGIVINATEISIPQNPKEEFYRRFDKVRASVVQLHFAGLPVDIDALCTHYLRIEKEIIALLGIESITMPMDLFSFLHTPKEGLSRIIYNRLFDLLQGKTTVEAFESQSAEDLKTSSADLYRLGYEWWAGLVLIKHLEPDKAFAVDLDDENTPFLTDLREISFGRQAHHPTIRIPEFVIHSQKLDRFVAVKMAIAREIETFVERFKPPVRPKKRTGDTSFALDSRVMLLSFMSGPQDIPIIAETYDQTLTRPDFMVECITAQEMRDPGALEQVKLRVEFMNPKQGMSLIVLGQEPEEAWANLPETIRPVSVGFDQTKLQAILSTLA